MLKEGIAKFPYFDKLYLMLGQLEERQGSLDAARAAYHDGLKRCMGSVPLWRSVARLEESAGFPARARAFLEQVIGLVYHIASHQLQIIVCTCDLLLCCCFDRVEHLLSVHYSAQSIHQ